MYNHAQKARFKRETGSSNQIYITFDHKDICLSVCLRSNVNIFHLTDKCAFTANMICLIIIIHNKLSATLTPFLTIECTHKHFEFMKIKKQNDEKQMLSNKMSIKRKITSLGGDFDHNVISDLKQ